MALFVCRLARILERVGAGGLLPSHCWLQAPGLVVYTAHVEVLYLEVVIDPVLGAFTSDT